jgi:hypothetical protein
MSGRRSFFSGRGHGTQLLFQQTPCTHPCR